MRTGCGLWESTILLISNWISGNGASPNRRAVSSKRLSKLEVVRIAMIELTASEAD